MSIQAYLSSLLDGPTEDSIASTELQDLFNDSSWQLSPDKDPDDEIPLPVLETTPWPSILDYLDTPNLQSSQPQSINTTAPASPSLAQYNEQSSFSKQCSLADRLRRHLPVSSTYNSLITLLSSSRTNDDIQSELIELMGFEGDALILIEELLQPRAREIVLEQTQHNSSQTSSPPRNGNGNGYLPSSRVTVKAKGKDRKVINISDVIGSAEDIERRIQEQLERPKAMFSDGPSRIIEEEVLPHVYTASGSKLPSMSYGGKFAMPAGTEREMYDTFEEVTVPPTHPVPPKKAERPVKIAELPPLAKGCFPNYIQLNRMQSIVQPTAMNTNENLLICAPTGAGKTDVAIMSIIRVLAQHLRPGPSTHPSGFSIDRDAFKIIYVAPMKALAAEITRKFGKRLAWLNIKVRELTGDMQLTRQEIAETQIIVTTPEKWDVVTRKPTGEGELASKVKLLIIDEVHLLNEDRGAVIETIVARTLRQVESSQSLIRIVGLSATLPNYIDVGDFLRVNRYTGLFFFDASFRPVPLEQHFIGVAGKPRSQISAKNMDRVVFDKVSELVQAGHQVMVFVHARKETVKTATTLKDMAIEEGVSSFFETLDHPKHGIYKRDIGTSRNKEMKELFNAGFGIHHAGMLRSDRNMMERMFEDNAINVLCCTSTLAWGVNLPAHAVIIKGTQVYDSNKGSFMDLSVLDVLQIFGRAGRPGYETSGVGYICTTHDKLDHYLYSIMAQHPIESKFIPGMVDSLNAEIALGTIANVQEAIQWLGYTYLFVRMRKEPFIYGMPHDVIKDDPQLGNKRNELVIQAARNLQAAKMIRYDEMANNFLISDLGRIAAKYYLRYQTIEVFNTRFNPRMSNADLFQMLCEATEFDQIQLRDSEVEELEAINKSDIIPLEVANGATDRRGKVNILLQAHVSRIYIEDFALVSDAAYVAQNAARIIRALLEIALSRHWANCSILLVELSKCIERRQWVYDHGLAQLNVLQKDTLHRLLNNLDETIGIRELREMTPANLGEATKLNEKHGAAILDACFTFPLVGLTYALRPISHDLLQITVHVEPQFKWSAKISGTTEPFYVWVQDEEGLNIFQWRSVLLRPNSTGIDIDFILPFDSVPSSVTLTAISDRWLWSHETVLVQLQDLIMPPPAAAHTEVLDIPFLRLSCFDHPGLEQAYKQYITTLNSIQSQAFWTFYHTSINALISAPVASGKSFLGEVAMWNAFRNDAEAVVLVIVPQHHSVRETVARIRSVTPSKKALSVVPLLQSSDFDQLSASSKGYIGVTTPSAMLLHEKVDDVLCLRRMALFVLEDLHLLDEAYELCIAKILSFARAARTRIVGITSSLSDPSDLANWLGVDSSPLIGDPTAPPYMPGLYSFSPSTRGNPISISIKTFTIPHSALLQRAMIKPTYDIIKTSSGSVIVFLPSRGACKVVANDLVKQSGTEMDLDGFLNSPRDHVEPLLQTRLKDQHLFEPILHGIGYLTPGAGMAPSDLALVLELFVTGIIKVLLVPREACWTLPVKANTVILMGAQYSHTIPIHTLPSSNGNGNGKRKEEERGERQVVNYTKEELVKIQGFTIPNCAPESHGGRLFVMCQSEQQVLISRILSEGLSLESKLPRLLSSSPNSNSTSSSKGEETLNKILKSRPLPPPTELDRPKIPDLRKRDMVDLLNYSFFNLRAKSNLSYYDLHVGQQDKEVSRLIDCWFEKRDPTVPQERGILRNKAKGKGKKGVEESGSVTGTGTGESGSRDSDSLELDEDGVNGQKAGIEMDSEQMGEESKVGEADGETIN